MTETPLVMPQPQVTRMQTHVTMLHQAGRLLECRRNVATTASLCEQGICMGLHAIDLRSGTTSHTSFTLP